MASIKVELSKIAQVSDNKNIYTLNKDTIINKNEVLIIPSGKTLVISSKIKLTIDMGKLIMENNSTLTLIEGCEFIINVENKVNNNLVKTDNKNINNNLKLTNRVQHKDDNIVNLESLTTYDSKKNIYILNNNSSINDNKVLIIPSKKTLFIAANITLTINKGGKIKMEGESKIILDNDASLIILVNDQPIPN